jgi:hypothetical protein
LAWLLYGKPTLGLSSLGFMALPDHSLQRQEDIELRQKREQLLRLQAELAQAELDYATAETVLAVFEQLYVRTIGVRLAELDEVKARMAEAVFRLTPSSNEKQSQADQARYQAKASQRSAAEAAPDETRTEFSPTEDLKKLFRELARQVHPDLAADAEDRARRNAVMTEVNLAYRAGDAARLRSLLEAWTREVKANHVSQREAEMARIDQAIEAIQRRLAELDTALRQLMSSDLAQLKQRADQTALQGRDLLSEIAAQVDTEVEYLWRRVRQAIQLLTIQPDEGSPA